MIFTYREPFIQERIQSVQEHVSRIIHDRDYQDTDDFILALRIIVSKEYKIPIFSKYFDSLTLDQLLFEVEVIKSVNTPPEERASKLINDNKDEVSEMFDDFAADDNRAPHGQEENSEFDKISQDFMQDNKFPGEE